MATRTVFEDENNNEMDCFLNDKGKLYIGISQKGEELVGGGFITLDKEDVKMLLKMLSDIENVMTD